MDIYIEMYKDFQVQTATEAAIITFPTWKTLVVGIHYFYLTKCDSHIKVHKTSFAWTAIHFSLGDSLINYQLISSVQITACFSKFVAM